MFKAIKTWHGGEFWWTLVNTDDRSFSHMVATKEEATEEGATVFVETDEPRFLIRDESGRGWATEVAYTSFTTEDREYREEGTDTDYAGNEVEFQSFGEWLDDSDAGDEFDNTDQNFTVTRIN
jgi:hypothetical protein